MFISAIRDSWVLLLLFRILVLGLAVGLGHLADTLKMFWKYVEERTLKKNCFVFS